MVLFAATWSLQRGDWLVTRKCEDRDSKDLFSSPGLLIKKQSIDYLIFIPGE